MSGAICSRHSGGGGALGAERVGQGNDLREPSGPGVHGMEREETLPPHPPLLAERVYDVMNTSSFADRSPDRTLFFTCICPSTHSANIYSNPCVPRGAHSSVGPACRRAGGPAP